MPKRSVYLPGLLDQHARAAGLSLSLLLQTAVRDALGLGRPAGDEDQAAAEWVTVQHAAARLGLTESRIHHLAAEGWLLTRLDGTRRLVLAESVTRELARRTPPYPAAAYVPRQQAAG
jgi:hypothetical protein